MAYDPHNVFAKILRKEISCRPVFEDDYALAFYDMHPRAPVHVLVIPKGEYVSYVDFHEKASTENIVGFWRAVTHVAAFLNVSGEGSRLISNQGKNGGQEVPHFHVHVVGGAPLGSFLCAHEK